MTKRSLIIALALALLCLCLCACGGKTQTEAAPVPSSAPAAAPVETPSPTEAPAPAAPVEVEDEVYDWDPAKQTEHPFIYVRGYTEPSDLLQGNIASLLGRISCESGIITEVDADITSADGKGIMASHYSPNTSSFSLAGSINADLKFATLKPGDYNYKLVVTAADEGEVSVNVLSDVNFTVFAKEDAALLHADLPDYVAKYSSGTSTEDYIWNYFLDYLGNPYGTAAILANIQAESGCISCLVEGDDDADLSLSKEYTDSVNKAVMPVWFHDRIDYVPVIQNPYDIEAYFPAPEGANMDTYSSEAFSAYINSEAFQTGYGLCQWRYSRKWCLFATYRNSAASFLSVDSVPFQCAFLRADLSANYPGLLEYLKNTTDYAEAAREFSYYMQAEDPHNNGYPYSATIYYGLMPITQYEKAEVEPYTTYRASDTPNNKVAIAKEYLDKFALPG